MKTINLKFISDNFPLANKFSHKTQNGILSVIAGSELTMGAPLFNLLGASTVGTGYIYGYVNKEALANCGIKCPWVVYRKDYQFNRENAVLIGSGCDNRENFDELLMEVLRKNENVVIDAYGLKRYKDLGLSSDNKVVMTPHLGEFSYLTGIPVKVIQQNPVKLAMEYAQKEKVIVVLKDYKTIITDGVEVYLNEKGNAGLAKAGSGDLLAGMIAGLIARKVKPLEAAAMACWLMGEAAEKAGLRVSIAKMNQYDIIDELDNLLLKCCK